MSNAATRDFLPTGLPSTVLRAVGALVQRHREVREAHLVGVRTAPRDRAAATLVVVADDSSVVAALERELRGLLKPHVRPAILALGESDRDLVRVRGIGGELKRGEERVPWWLFFLGI